jgi:predicted ATPase
MSKIRVKNFGPIKEGLLENDGWIDIKKVSVFIGNQGSGKSTLAKLISTMMWMEKAINRGDFSSLNWSFSDFIKYTDYQRLEGYFDAETIIEYEGDLYSIYYNRVKNKWPLFEKKESINYIVPKIMYVPAERNFLSVVKNANSVKGLPYSLFEFAEELIAAQSSTFGIEIPLPINTVKYEYDSEKEASFIVGANYRVNLLSASSGFQSLVPLYLVSKYLAVIINNGPDLNPSNINISQSIRMNQEISSIMLENSLLDKQKIEKVELVKAKFINKAFINIVEEPEQNLFPSSQRQILNSLLEFNNMNEGNKLIMTTHSPYLINYLTLSVKADKLKNEVSTENLKSKLSEVVPLNSTVNADDLAIYELDESDGTIKKLSNFEGIPSDNNYLNKSLAECNELFDALLEIEEEI